MSKLRKINDLAFDLVHEVMEPSEQFSYAKQIYDLSDEPQLSESQQIVLDWLKNEMKKKDTFPISCLWELQSWYAPKNVCSAYLTLNKEQQFELIKAWEQEEAE